MLTDGRAYRIRSQLVQARDNNSAFGNYPSVVYYPICRRWLVQSRGRRVCDLLM
jgi:hypothetical protein